MLQAGRSATAEPAVLAADASDAEIARNVCLILRLPELPEAAIAALRRHGGDGDSGHRLESSPAAAMSNGAGDAGLAAHQAWWLDALYCLAASAAAAPGDNGAAVLVIVYLPAAMTHGDMPLTATAVIEFLVREGVLAEPQISDVCLRWHHERGLVVEIVALAHELAHERSNGVTRRRI